MASNTIASPLTDFILPFQLGEEGLRGRVIQLDKAITTILNAHRYPLGVSGLTSDAACLAAMMGSSLKFDGKLIFQAQGNGDVPLAIADFKTGGALRAMVKADAAVDQISDLSVFGKGQIAITIDQGADMERYQGVTPLEGKTLAGAAESYFMQSEQLPTKFKTALGKITLPGQDETWRAGGMMVQQTPPAERGVRDTTSLVQEQWDDALAFFETIEDDELLDPNITAEALLFRLFHSLDVRVFDPIPLYAQCGCSADSVAVVLQRYSAEDLSDMLEDGVINVTCEFCTAAYQFDDQGAQINSS